jgi:hypothetical protein
MTWHVTVLDVVSAWRPRVGDPSLTGWLIVAGYALAASLSLMAWRASRSAAGRLGLANPAEAVSERRLAWFWLLACVMATALGINKQLDLQSLFTDVLREVAHAQGWYDDRRRYQFRFVVTIAGLGLLAVLTTSWMLRRVLARVWTAVLGLGWVTAFVVIRAASFHHVETFLQRFPPGMNAAFELAGIALVAVGARRELRTRREGPPRRRGQSPGPFDAGGMP